MQKQIPQIKICGLRTPDDARLLNEAGADYAGFVFHAPSRRNIHYDEARAIMDALDPAIRRVAVVVSPTPERACEIQELPFDIIQIHGNCLPETMARIHIPVWRAVNIANIDELTVSVSEEGMERISGILVDAKEYGSGKTFDWAAAEQIRKAVRRLCAAIEEKRRLQAADAACECLHKTSVSGIDTGASGSDAGADGHVKFILAGGLNAANAAEGIRLFAPDVVDVSSGVEYDAQPGKDPEKVRAFADAVRQKLC